MQIQVHSDNHIEGSARLADWVSASVAGKLDRYDDELTRVVVHLNDENGDKAGAHDKRCQIEARPKGLQPISVTHKAESLELAIDGAVDKLVGMGYPTDKARRGLRRSAPRAPPGGPVGRAGSGAAFPGSFAPGG